MVSLQLQTCSDDCSDDGSALIGGGALTRTTGIFCTNFLAAILYGAYNILAAILYAMRTKVLATRLYAAHTPPFVQTSWRPFCAMSSPLRAELVNLLHLATALLLSTW